jgi:hypothetical protein
MYVKHLEELIDIYIKPTTVLVNKLSSAGSSKDTVIPAAKRKTVFGGINSLLLLFHKERFLPALEIAVVPVIKDPAVVKEADSNSQLLLMVVEAVANMFIQQVAFTSSSFHCSLCPPCLPLKFTFICQQL